MRACFITIKDAHYVSLLENDFHQNNLAWENWNDISRNATFQQKFQAFFHTLLFN